MGGMEDVKKIPWVKWDTICLECGGLAIRDISFFDDVFLAKWKWRLMDAQGELWKEVIFLKYQGWESIGRGGKGERESMW